MTHLYYSCQQGLLPLHLMKTEGVYTHRALTSQSPCLPVLAATTLILKSLHFSLWDFTLQKVCCCSVAQSLNHVQLFAIPRTAARQASLSFTMSQSFSKLMSIESVMPSNHLTPFSSQMFNFQLNLKSWTYTTILMPLVVMDLSLIHHQIPPKSKDSL